MFPRLSESPEATVGVLCRSASVSGDTQPPLPVSGPFVKEVLQTVPLFQGPPRVCPPYPPLPRWVFPTLVPEVVKEGTWIDLTSVGHSEE